ncbi:MAG TPA: HAMP domain-containing sensor histidine kinase [Bacteroidales bacterium]|nr:HAMP domain-containing sensor histidine kinase [Bacteroidales bacterium]
MINYAPPGKLAFLTSIILALVFSLTYGAFSVLIYGEFHFRSFILANVLLVIVSFFLFRYVLNKFIYDRIRLIYKTIHDLKAPKGQKKVKISDRTDLIQKTNLEVLEWASDKKKEVEELQKLEAYRREFLGNVSHELKTPIFNIQGYVLTLLDGGIDDPEINRKYLLRTEQSIDRMISIIEDLEAISSLESGELKLKISPFDLAALTKEVMDFVEIKATARNIRIHFARNYDAPVIVEADREKIQQVMTNLLVNSIKYGNENGRVKIGFFDMDENILVEVTDNGIGISRDELPRVFERFYRGDKSRTFRNGEGGTGLGLAIVKHIIEAHNQTISVRSTLGLGATFAFTLKKRNPHHTGFRNVFSL